MRPTTTLNWFFLKPPKIDGDLKVSIGLQDIHSGRIEPAICSGILTDCSEEGGCLLLSRLIVDGKHIFFSTLNSERYHLVIGFDQLASSEHQDGVVARSIWMDSRRRKDSTVFKMGIRFLNRQKDLFNQLRDSQYKNRYPHHPEGVLPTH